MLLQFTEELGKNFFLGKVDYDIIKKVKEAVNIPVIGNGDIIDEKSAKEMFDKTNCDAIMIGRGSNGNPWIFEQIISFLKEGIIKEKPGRAEIKATILRHLDMLTKYSGEKKGILEMRKHISWYIKGMPNASEYRKELFLIEDLDKLVRKIDEMC